MWDVCGQCFVFHMWMLGSNIAIIIRTVCTGHVVSVVCSVCGWWDKNIVIGLYVLAMWLVLFLMYVGGIL